jgi:hypothetical protein
MTSILASITLLGAAGALIYLRSSARSRRRAENHDHNRDRPGLSRDPRPASVPVRCGTHPAGRALPEQRPVRDGADLPTLPHGQDPRVRARRLLEGTGRCEAAVGRRGAAAASLVERPADGRRLGRSPGRGHCPTVLPEHVAYARSYADATTTEAGSAVEVRLSVWWSALIDADQDTFGKALSLAQAPPRRRTPVEVAAAYRAALEVDGSRDEQIAAGLAAVRERWQTQRLDGFTVVSRTRSGVVFRRDVSDRETARCAAAIEAAMGRTVWTYYPGVSAWR